MNKFFCALISFVLAASCSWADVAINDANFPDEIFRAYISERFDTDKDNILSNSEITSATNIDVRGKGIMDLSGIKKFTSLKTLYCSHNGLTKLDVSDMKNLRSISCGFNNIETLDIAGCISLEWLSCLEVSGLSKLIRLDCSKNKLSVLDVSKNIALIQLDYYSNNLNALNLQNNSLSCTNNKIEELDCSENQIMTLDLTRHANLDYVYLGRQSISKLVVHSDSDGFYYVDLVNDYGFTPEELSSIINNGSNLIAYDEKAGIAEFSTRPTKFYYDYYNGAANLKDTNPLVYITIYAMPKINITELETGYVNRRYVAILQAAGAGNLSWSIDNESKLPVGSDSKTFTLEIKSVSDSPESPIILTQNSEIPSGFVNSSYSLKFTASGALILNWYIDKGEVPGLNLSNSEYSRGTPGQTRAFDITVKAEDKESGSDSKIFTIGIKSASESPQSPVIITNASEIPSGFVNTRYNLIFQSLYTRAWYIDKGEVPGLTLSTADYLMAGSFDITVIVENTKGGKVSKTFTIKINPEENKLYKPEITKYYFSNGVKYKSYFSQLEAAGTQPIKCRKLPDNVYLSGIISGVPSKSGIFRFTLQASNVAGKISIYIAAIREECNFSGFKAKIFCKNFKEVVNS